MQAIQRETLGDLLPGQSGVVYRLDPEDRRMKRRLVAMGVTPGTRITVIKTAPLGDPVEVALRSYWLSLRQEDARHILLLNPREEARLSRARLKDDSAQSERLRFTTPTLRGEPQTRVQTSGEYRRKAGKDKSNAGDVHARLALAGNPNCGKTTLFNALTGSSAHVGNWPGVTVEKKEGRVRAGGVQLNITLVDLPGIYSLSPHSMEEIVARNYILDERPDAVVNILDATNLERNLYLTLQLLELGVPVVIALNMMDEVEQRCDSIDCKALSLGLGVPVFPLSARSGEGVAALSQYLSSALDTGWSAPSTEDTFLSVYDAPTYRALDAVGAVAGEQIAREGFPQRWAELKLLERDELLLERLELSSEAQAQLSDIIQRFESGYRLGESESVIADARYTFIEALYKRAYTQSSAPISATLSDKIDAVLTNKYLSLPLFALIMGGIFTLTFSTLGRWLSEGISLYFEYGVLPLARNLLQRLAAPMWFQSLICDGALGGIGGVLAFLPQIVLLYLCLSLLEDSGYMSRIAFIMDKPMRRFGLSGKSFIPMLMGFGCTVPAAVAARAMDNQQDKRMTILLLPFMSCSAKLPVYGLVAGALFAKGSGLVILSLYGLGIIFGILSGLLFRKTLLGGSAAPFVMEFAPYRLPLARNILLRVWERVSHFIEKAGTVILAMSVLLWFLQNFDTSLHITQDARESILYALGGLIAPLLAPLGFGTWQAAVALLTGLIAKETVVTSLSMFYGGSPGGVSTALRSAFTPLGAYAFLVMVLLYTPCIAAMATIRKELESPGLTAFIAVYQVALAYFAALLVYTLGGLIL